MSEFTGEVHPLAADFPMVGADELADLAQSIRDQGQLDPITLTPDGMLLDGRNRLAACELAGVEPKFETYDGDPVAFIVGKNANRRQLSSGQRAMAIAMGMWESKQWNHDVGSWKRDGRISNFASAKLASTTDLALCGTILAHSRDYAREVLAGDSLRAKYDAVKREQEAATERDRQRETLRDKAPDLLAQVTDETLTLPEAWAAYEIRYAKQIESEQADIELRRKTNTDFAESVAALRAYGQHPERLTNLLATWNPDDTAAASLISQAAFKDVARAMTEIAKKWSSK